jgi:hypothetical protein
MFDGGRKTGNGALRPSSSVFPPKRMAHGQVELVLLAGLYVVPRQQHQLPCIVFLLLCLLFDIIPQLWAPCD